MDDQSATNVFIPRPTDQIIIKFNTDGSEKGLLTTNIHQQLVTYSDMVGQELHYARPMSGQSHVLKLSERLPVAAVEEMAAELSALPEVAYAEPDRIKTIGTNPAEKTLVPTLMPNDTRWGDMWHLRYTANSDEGVNMVPVWDIAIGLSTTIVAVIDTGILNHSDLAGKTVAGYDFIGDIPTANDGNGRDNDPSDPGDWYAANQCGGSHGAENSSWHGTHVAASNNNSGITGINWNAKILPIRVLGTCGGYVSDIVDGMRWAAGLAVSGVPNNPNPADVLNLSLGGSGACDASSQDAIDDVVATGATIVIAAGNENVDASNSSPGNCNNVITVAATNRGGDRASYSNYGALIEISAPGGETTGANGVLSTLDSGTTTPNNDNVYAFYPGTSMATPHVAGVVSLVKSVKPNYTQSEVLSLLQGTARSFPAGSGCNTNNCGAGIVDAYRALNFFNITFTEFTYLPIVLKPEPEPDPEPEPEECTPQGGESNNINDALITCSGHSVNGQVSSGDRDDVYRIQMEANQFLTINMAGGGGNADLYLYPPGTSDVNTDPFAAYSVNEGNNETIAGQVLTGGYWYIDVFSMTGTTSYIVQAIVENGRTGEKSVYYLTPENLFSFDRHGN